LIIFQDIDHSRLQTYIFTLAVFIELFAVFAVRSNKPFWQENPFKNKLLVLAVIFSVILQLIAIYSPISSLLQTKPLVAWEWGMIILISAVSYLIIELVKHFKPEFLTKA
jgi:Ca2+-transporting ATPase